MLDIDESDIDRDIIGYYYALSENYNPSNYVYRISNCTNTIHYPIIIPIYIMKKIQQSQTSTSSHIYLSQKSIQHMHLIHYNTKYALFKIYVLLINIKKL